MSAVVSNKYLDDLQAENAQLKKALEFIAPKVDCAMCLHRRDGDSFNCGRNDLLCGKAVIEWAMSEVKRDGKNV